VPIPARRWPRQLPVINTNPIERESNREVVGAAQAAASWIRARRAAWSDSPLEILPAPTAEPPTAATKRDLPVVVPFGLTTAPTRPTVDWPAALVDDGDFTAGIDVATAVAPPRKQSAAASAMARIHMPSGRWMLSAGAMAAAVTIAVTTRPYWPTGMARAKATVQALDAAAASRVAQHAAVPVNPVKTTGRLELTSEPAAAQVLLDGKSRGVTPLTVDDLTPGTHTLELQSSEGSIRRSFVVKAGETAQLAESIFGGWVKVFAPFEVTVREGSKVLRLEEGNQIMLPAGGHDLHVVNRQLAYDTVHHVDLKPGEMSSIQVAAPTSTIAVRTSAPAEIWIDGVRAGEAPLSSMAVALGTHEVVARQAGGEERRSVVTVTVQPLTVDIDFGKP
jgi:hypothetical protein